MTAAVLCLKVTLDDVEPKVLRRIEVPADIKLDRLHLTLQAALGWTNSHLFEIRVRIPTKPATHSNRKPATDSDLKPAGVPI